MPPAVFNDDDEISVDEGSQRLELPLLLLLLLRFDCSLTTNTTSLETKQRRCDAISLPRGGDDIWKHVAIMNEWAIPNESLYSHPLHSSVPPMDQTVDKLHRGGSWNLQGRPSECPESLPNSIRNFLFNSWTDSTAAPKTLGEQPV